MSISGPGLYDDDAGADVKLRFRELISDGQMAGQARETLVAEWGAALDDRDQRCAFWLALADTESRTGRLEDVVRQRALALIDSGEDLARFESAPALHRKRHVILDELRARLTGPQRTPVRIRKPFRSVSPVGVGDIFTFELPSGREVWMRCLAVQGDQLDNSPTVEILDWDRTEPPRDPARLQARKALPYRSDRFWLIRYASDPDPAERIRIVAKATPVSRSPLPCVMAPWAELEERLAREFGS